MPRARRDTRGICRCGGRTELREHPVTKEFQWTCELCGKRELDCDCEHTVVSRCKYCGEVDGSRAEKAGKFYSNGHRCRS